MRFAIATTTASLLLLGAAVAGTQPAFADDDAYFNHAKGTMSGSLPAGAAPTGAATTQGHYLQVDPRDTQVQSSASDDETFNHAKGTMSGAIPESAPAGQNGSYVASYHQYMQVDPRDTKAGADGSRDVDGNNPWFNHAKGTMSGN